MSDDDATFRRLDLLDDRLDDLTKALSPLLSQGIQDNATKLPVADKARLYVLTTYTIESLLFSYLRLNGITAKDHPVMRELARVRQYVTKIKSAQPSTAAATTAATAAQLSLDKDAANRFIKAALAGNDRHDVERAAVLARERAAAEVKLVALGRRGRGERGEEGQGQGQGQGEEREEREEREEEEEEGAKSKAAKKKRKRRALAEDAEHGDDDGNRGVKVRRSKGERERRKAERRDARRDVKRKNKGSEAVAAAAAAV